MQAITYVFLMHILCEYSMLHYSYWIILSCVYIRTIPTSIPIVCIYQNYSYGISIFCVYIRTIPTGYSYCVHISELLLRNIPIVLTELFLLNILIVWIYQNYSYGIFLSCVRVWIALSNLQFSLGSGQFDLFFFSFNWRRIFFNSISAYAGPLVLWLCPRRLEVLIYHPSMGGSGVCNFTFDSTFIIICDILHFFSIHRLFFMLTACRVLRCID